MMTFQQTSAKSISHKKALLQIGLVIFSLGILYKDVAIGLLDDWWNLPDFSHGFFIPLLSLYFVWERKDELVSIRQNPSNLGLVPLLLGLSMLGVGSLAAEQFTMRVSLLFVIVGVILFLMGREAIKILIFPVCFLAFMIPLPSILLDKITFPLQLFASRIATLAIQAFGIPVLREGNVITLTTTTLEVAEACSGLRSLISLISLGVVFAYFTKKIFWQRVALVALCIPIAIFVNSLRVTITGIMASYYGESVAKGFYHDFSGYLLFIVALLLLFCVSGIFTYFSRKRVGLK